MRLRVPIDTPAAPVQQKSPGELTEVYLNSDKVGGATIQLMDLMLSYTI